MYTSCLLPHVCCVVYRFPEALTTPKYLPCFDKRYLSGEVTTSGHSPFSLTVHRCFTVFQRQCSEKSDASVVFCFVLFLYMLPVPLLPEGYIVFSLSLEFRNFPRIYPVCVRMFLIMSGICLLSPFFLMSQISVHSAEGNFLVCVFITSLIGILLSSYSSHIRSPGFVSSS